MDDVHSAGVKPYEKCTTIETLTLSDRLKLYSFVLFDIIKLIYFGIFVVVKEIIELFWSKPPKNISGQIAFVTGAGNGLGREIAINLAAKGCHIVIGDVDMIGANETVKLIKNYNVKALAYKIDVSDEKAVHQLRLDIENDLGPVDILINNAGLIPKLSIRDGKTADIRKIVDVNILSHFWMVREFIDGMIERRRGHIVGIASMAAIHPIGGLCVYTATKFAVSGFMRSFHDELRQEGKDKFIKMTCVYPYFISTRKDLTDFVTLRFPALTVEHVGKTTVDGIIHNKRSVGIPNHIPYLQILHLLPDKLMDLFRDIILRESEIKSNCNKQK